MPNIRRIFLKLTAFQQWNRLSYEIKMVVEYILATGGRLNVMASQVPVNVKIQWSQNF